MKTIAITGAGGFLGGVLTQYFSDNGYLVRRLVRDPEGGAESYRFDLTNGFDENALLGVDVLIHAAHDFTPRKGGEMKRINVEGSRKLFESAKKAGVAKIIFISSVSAFPGCASLYGNAKLEIEELARQCGGKSVRPGLIYGREGKGMFGSLEKIVTKLPLIPVFDGGGQKMVLAQVDDLAHAIGKVIEEYETLSTESITLANPEEVPFRELLSQIATKVGKRPHFVTVPSSFALFGLRTLEAIHVRLPFRSDSLVSLLNANPKLNISSNMSSSMRPFVAGAQTFK